MTFSVGILCSTSSVLSDFGEQCKWSRLGIVTHQHHVAARWRVQLCVLSEVCILVSMLQRTALVYSLQLVRQQWLLCSRPLWGTRGSTVLLLHDQFSAFLKLNARCRSVRVQHTSWRLDGLHASEQHASAFCWRICVALGPRKLPN